MNLLIAIPTFNESRDVTRVLDELGRYGHSVLIVDDGSTDGTAELLAQRHDVGVLRHPRNLGYGRSLIDAFAHAGREGFDWVLTMDADGQHEADSIPDFVRAASEGELDLISGSRYLAARSDDDLPPPQRRGINHRITLILNELFGLDLTDAFCGFKLHRTTSMLELGLTEAGYAFPLQLWPRVWERQLRLREIPVRRIYNDPNRSFGAALDNAEMRYRLYLEVLNRELLRMGLDEVTPDGRRLLEARAARGCTC